MNVRKIYKSFISAILSGLLVISAIIASDGATADFIVADSSDNKQYQVTQRDNTLHISGENYSAELNLYDEVVNVLCHNNILSLLCVTESAANTFFYTIRIFNTTTKDLSAIATTITATSKEQDFYTDNNGTYYIPDNLDNRRIHIVSTNHSDIFSVSAPVYQLLYAGNNRLLVFCGDGTYLICGNKITLISSLLPGTPCFYNGDNIITDSLNKRYLLNGTTFTELIENTTMVNHTDEPSATSSYIIDGSRIFLTAGTTFAKLYKYLGTDKSELTVYKSDGKAVTSGRLGTGMVAEFSDKSFTIIIVGDLTGEGNINSRDLKALLRHLSDETLLSEPFLSAANIYKDDLIDTKDLLALSKLY